MAKRDQKKEKDEKNAIYSLKYKKTVSLEELAAKKELRWKGGPWANWCRTKDHPPNCDCAYR